LAKLNFPKVDDVFELNDYEARVVGIVDGEPNFFANPTVYTTYDRAMQFAPSERKRLTFVLAKPQAGYTVQQVAANIRRQTELAAYTKDEMMWKTIWYYLKNTGIGINIGMVTFLAFLVGIAIAGQTFYAFTLENLKQFGALKAMGASNFTLLGMIVLQSLIVGFIGYGLGVGLSAGLVMFLLKNASNFAAFTPYQLLLISGGATLFICMFASVISLSKVLRLEPAIVFRG
jgi:putative ABC transport system permease protein